jgi:hypothetical protein
MNAARTTPIDFTNAFHHRGSDASAEREESRERTPIASRGQHRPWLGRPRPHSLHHFSERFGATDWGYRLAGMTSAAIRILLFVTLVFGGPSGSALAGVQLDPAETLSSAVSSATSPTGQASDLTNSVGAAVDDVTGTVNDVAEDPAGTVNDATLDSATSSITGALSGSSGSGADGASSGGGSGSNSTSGRSSSSSGQGSTSNRGSPRTRFDRLPRQYERLLERIESGVDVRASIGRLHALLARASPRLRTQILRLIHHEIRRLRRGGLTHQERAAARRLTPLLKALEASRPPAQISLPSGTASLPASDGRSQIAGISDGSLRTERPAGSGQSGSRLTPQFPLPLPSPAGTIYWLAVLLAAIAGFLWLTARARRNALPSAVRGSVEVRGAELSVLAALIAIVGAAWAVLLQLLFL